MKIEVSIGEIVDKLSILKIKSENITDSIKLKNVVNEYDYLFNVVENELNISTDNELYKELLLIIKSYGILKTVLGIKNVKNLLMKNLYY